MEEISPQKQEAIEALAKSYYEALHRALKNPDGGVPLELLILTASRMSGTLMLRQMNLDTSRLTPGEPLRNDVAQHHIHRLTNLAFVTLKAVDCEVDPDKILNKMDASLLQATPLAVSQETFESLFRELADKAGLMLKEAAISALFTSVHFVKAGRTRLDAHRGGFLVIAGLNEALTKVPAPFAARQPVQANPSASSATHARKSPHPSAASGATEISLTDTLEFTYGASAAYLLRRSVLWFLGGVFFLGASLATRHFTLTGTLVILLPSVNALLAFSRWRKAEPIRHLDLTATHLAYPPGGGRVTYVKVPYPSITRIAVDTVEGTQSVVITHAMGDVRFAVEQFPDRDAQQFYEELVRRTQAASKAGTAPKPSLDLPPEAAIPEEKDLPPMPDKDRPLDPNDPALDALQRYIKAHQAEDPLIGAKIGGKQVAHSLMGIMTDSKGIHIDSLLTALGALAGYACQVAAFHSPEVMKDVAVMKIEGEDGRTYLFGNAANATLIESPISLWSLAAGQAKALGYEDVEQFDVLGIFKHVAGTIGSEAYGVPRWIEGHVAGSPPIEYLLHLWPIMQYLASKFCENRAQWHQLFGFAIQEIMRYGASVLVPEIALHIVMESAVPMAKIDMESFRKYEEAKKGDGMAEGDGQAR